MNARREEWAAVALHCFAAVTHTRAETEQQQTTDLICNLLHQVARRNHSMSQVLDRAIKNYIYKPKALKPNAITLTDLPSLYTVGNILEHTKGKGMRLLSPKIRNFPRFLAYCFVGKLKRCAALALREDFATDETGVMWDTQKNTTVNYCIVF